MAKYKSKSTEIEAVKFTRDNVEEVEEFTEYKGYKGTIEYSYSDNIYYGNLLNIEDSISYHASNVMRLHERFKEVVDDYILLKQSTQ